MSDWFDAYGHDEVADGLVSGALPGDAADVALLAREGVTRVLNLVEDREYAEDMRTEVVAALAFAGIEEERVSLVDFGGLDVGALEAAVQIVLAWLGDGERVYVHCRAGWQRSTTVAAAVLAVRDGIEPDAALRRIAERRAVAEPLPHQRQDLLRWWDLRDGTRSVR